MFIRRKTVNMLFHVNTHSVTLACTHQCTQKILAQRKPVMQALQQGQVPQRQEWEFGSEF